MNNKIKVLRSVVLTLLIGFLVVVALSYRSRGSTTTEGEAKPIESTIRQDEKPESIAELFDETQTIGGRVVTRVRARRTMGFESGWYTLEDVQLTVYRPDGKTYDLFCPQAQVNAETKAAEAKGGVRLTSSDGIEILTDELSFDGNQMINRIPVRFKMKKWEGRAGGVELNVENESLRLKEGVHLSMAAASGTDAPITLDAKEAVVLRKTNEVSFIDEVRITRGQDEILASTITAQTDETQGHLRALAGEGNVVISVSKGSELLEKSKETTGVRISSDSFFGEFDGAGAFTAFLAVSKEQSHAVLSGMPRREIDARQFRVVFASNVPIQLQIDHEVSMREIGVANRTITAENATLFFDPATRKPSNGNIIGSVRFDDGKYVATANQASFDFSSSRVYLTSTPDAPPSLVSDTQKLRANLIEIATTEGTLDAKGNVVTTLIPKKGGGSAAGTSIFPSSATPVFVNSDRLLLRQQQKAAVFSGNVRAWQDANTLLANELQVLEEGRVIRAQGAVRVVLYNARDNSKIPTRASADLLTANRAEHKIDLEGHVKIDDERQSMTSARTVLTFDANNKLQRAESTGSVTLTERATGRKGAGETLVYDIDQKKASLRGAPASLTDTQGTAKGDEIIFDLAKNRVDVIGGSKPTETTYTPPKP